jgi:translation elongation factor EF-Tu-like GTPase
VQVSCPEDLKERFSADILQFTLVDCPGHASLLKTVLVGAQIIDMMLLVIDATKGIQTQTAECIIVGELLSQCAVVALNKIDLFPAERRQKEARRCGRRIVEALQLTRFAAAEIVPVSAKNSSSSVATDTDDVILPEASKSSPASLSVVHKPQNPQNLQNPQAESLHRSSGDPQDADTVPIDSDGKGKGKYVAGCTIGMHALKEALLKNVPQLKRDTKAPFLFMADHCFQIKGHGTVLSGAACMLLLYFEFELRLSHRQV